MTTTSLRRPETPREFQAMNEHSFGALNKEFYSDEALVARLIREIGLLVKVVRKDYREDFKIHLADIFSWYNAVANRLGLDVHDIFWQKYPGACSYCLRSEKCMCGIEHPPEPEEKMKRLRALRLDRKGREPRTFVEHQALNARLYAWQHERDFPIIIAARIVEEATELSEAFYDKDMEGVDEEMADILSWLLTLTTRMRWELDEIMWGLYPYICRGCGKELCVCKQKVRR